jgi:glycosyltransferase involved in cell wall biosynthesis
MDRESPILTESFKKVSIVIPAKDEEETIGDVLRDLNKIIPTLPYEFEVFVIADHCKDKTAEISTGLGATVLVNQGSGGKGNALKVGFKVATGDVVVMLDADYSHRPEDLPKFLDGLKSGAGLVVGSRIFGGSDEYTRVRASGNFIFTAFFGLLFNYYLSDALNGYKAFRKEIVKNFIYKSTNFEIEIELLANTIRNKMKILEVPSHERSRAGGKMKSNTIIHGTKFLLRTLYEGVRYNLGK